MHYNPINEAKGEVGENLVNHTFTSKGYTVKYHNVDDYGCDGIFYGNGVDLGCYEVNYWKPNTYFSDKRIDSTDYNLYNGLEWLNGNYVNNRDKIQYRFHITIGATRSEAQIVAATELGIIYIHFNTLPTEDELWNAIAPKMGFRFQSKLASAFNRFIKVNVIGYTYTKNDRTIMMVLLTPIISNIISNIQVITSLISSKVNGFCSKMRLKRSLFRLKSFVRARRSKSYSNNKSRKVIME